MSDKPIMATDADLPPHVLGVLEAGRAMATELQGTIDACGYSLPDGSGCPTCAPAREAIYRWLAAVAALRAMARSVEVER